jgi:hypothetical protein
MSWKASCAADLNFRQEACQGQPSLGMGPFALEKQLVV